ncbi:Thioredoxin [Candidatus Methanoperedenaceae archaeon GB37]|nr:Thioredoxin [Candidatus Methanoperedenaceae archaeon GB37]
MKEVSIKVFGTEPPCAKCNKAYKIATEVQKDFKDHVKVEKVNAMSEEGDKYGIMMTPTIVVNENVVCVGREMPKNELEKIVKRELEVE